MVVVCAQYTAQYQAKTSLQRCVLCCWATLWGGGETLDHAPDASDATQPTCGRQPRIAWHKIFTNQGQSQDSYLLFVSWNQSGLTNRNSINRDIQISRSLIIIRKVQVIMPNSDPDICWIDFQPWQKLHASRSTISWLPNPTDIAGNLVVFHAPDVSDAA